MDPVDEFPLTDEHRMLLQIRDTLYEGNWEDFVRDLEDRANDRPHVFQTIPDTPGMAATITHHLSMIADMQRWEDTHGQTLTPEGTSG